MAETIKFYKKDDPYGWMSKFYPAKIKILEREYPTSEHYYQSCKFVSPYYHGWVADAPTAHLAFKCTRLITELYPNAMREDWNDIKLGVMETAVDAKFMQNPELREMLLNTGDAILVEDSPVDSYWGCGKDGSGKNMLGVVLMGLRESYRE